MTFILQDARSLIILQKYFEVLPAKRRHYRQKTSRNYLIIISTFSMKLGSVECSKMTWERESKIYNLGQIRQVNYVFEINFLS